jgi:hypothetical protein
VLQAATTNSTTDITAARIGSLQIKGHINLIILFLSPLCSTAMVLPNDKTIRIHAARSRRIIGVELSRTLHNIAAIGISGKATATESRL